MKHGRKRKDIRHAWQAFGRRFFGVRGEGLVRPLIVSIVMFYGLHETGISIAVRPFFFFLVISAFTAGVMWQALQAESAQERMQGMFLLPFAHAELTLSYIGMLSTHTVVTKTLPLLAVLAAVMDGEGLRLPGVLFCGLLCAVQAALAAACVYGLGKCGLCAVLFGVLPLLALLLLETAAGGLAVFLCLLLAEGAAACRILGRTDAYRFCRQRNEKAGRLLRGRREHSVFRYFFRYLWLHKNYLVNTAGMCAAACLLPFLFGEMDAGLVLPLGFAVLSLNTPLCILLSCDPSLERAVRFLPGQGRAFFLPYGAFLLFIYLLTDTVFLISFETQRGGVTAGAVLTAFAFALTAAVLSVLLEWYFPLRNWKTESDLWHHPRKYVVPGLLTLLSGMLSGAKILS